MVFAVEPLMEHVLMVGQGPRVPLRNRRFWDYKEGVFLIPPSSPLRLHSFRISLVQEKSSLVGLALTRRKFEGGLSPSAHESMTLAMEPSGFAVFALEPLLFLLSKKSHQLDTILRRGKVVVVFIQ